LQCGANETLDVLLYGRVKIIQRRDGYRVNEDSLRLCEFVGPMPKTVGIDLGAGCGIVAIVLVLEGKVKSMVALELQERLVQLARRNVALNGFGGRPKGGREESERPGRQNDAGSKESSRQGERIEVIRGDIRQIEKLLEPHSFGLAVSNPPYRGVERSRPSPSVEKNIARQEQRCSLPDLVWAAAYLLKPEGLFVFCQLKERWEEIAEILAANNFSVSRREIVGSVVMIEARKSP